MIRKNNNSSVLLIITGLLAIIIVTIAVFFKDNIIYKYYEYKIDKDYSSTNTNSYYVEDNFEFVDEYVDTGIKSREDFINFIYFALNSGTDYIERYIDKNYSSYDDDVAKLTENDGDGFKETISILK